MFVSPALHSLLRNQAVTRLCKKGTASAGPQVLQNECGLQPLPSQFTLLGEFRNSLVSLGNGTKSGC